MMPSRVGWLTAFVMMPLVLLLMIYTASSENQVTVCPAFVPGSHPRFVCPPEVLARRHSMPGNHTREYERLGGASTLFSQFWEDWFLYSEFFHDERYRGADFTFIELGGYDGRSGSNSHFYDRQLGWKGLMLEASTPNYAALEKSRLSPSVATIHGAVCREPRMLSLWGGASLTANNRQEANGLFHGDQQTSAVCLAMSTYLTMVQPLANRTITRIDYFSIDVEGQELEVILSHDWARYPVFVVSIEVAVQPLLSGTAEQQHEKRCALYQRGLCRWPFYDGYRPPVPFDETLQFWLNNEIWVNPAML